MCEICGKSLGHYPRCPYYEGGEFEDEYQETGEFCVICGCKILVGDHVLCNVDDHFHYTCFKNTPTDELVTRLSFEEKFM